MMPDDAGRRDLSHYTVHMVGNAHIDPVWQWRWEEGRQEVLDTCRAALERIKDTDGFIFCQSSAVMYEWIEQEDPILFEEIKKAIEAGQWCLVGGWWVEPDCNVPCGESLVRHGLYGQGYFYSRFGKLARTGWNVDTFGHAGQIPQILLGQGMRRYCFFRPGPHEKGLPSTVFWWEAPDGTRVLAARMPGHYGTDPGDIEQRIYDAAAQTPLGLEDHMSFYGVGNHGGGPTLQNIASIRKVNAAPRGPRVIFSTPDAFFDKIHGRAAAFPVVAEELQYHSRGCYTAVSSIKRHNRLSENLLMDAEKLSVMAWRLVGLEYPAGDLAYAWKKVLFNQFHDILAGTSIRPACDDAVTDYEEAETLAQRTLRTAMARISAQVDCPGEGRPIVAYNTLSWARTEVVEAEVTWPNHDDRVHIVDEAGRPVPFQVLETCISGRGTTVRVVFLAELPACGYRTYRMLQGAGLPQISEFQAGRTFLEGMHWRLEFDPDAGYLTKLVDRATGQDLLGGPANVPLVLSDPSDTWSHGVDSFHDEIGRFAACGSAIVEMGPVRARMLIEMEHSGSSLVQDVRLYRDVPRIDVVLTVDYHGEHEFLKLAFPTALSETVATYETPYGYAVRPAEGTEEPAQKWADVTGRLPDGSIAGLAVLNDAKYGCDICGGELRLSVLRTPIYCFHEPAKVDPRQRYEFVDQGVQRFTYSLLPHAGDWREGEVVRQAQQLNHPCLVREEPAHKGRLRAVYSLVEIDVENVVVEVVKQTEWGRGVVLRAYETHGRETTATLRLRSPRVPATELYFRPCEIKTLIVSRGRVMETDLLEGLATTVQG